MGRGAGVQKRDEEGCGGLVKGRSGVRGRGSGCVPTLPTLSHRGTQSFACAWVTHHAHRPLPSAICHLPPTVHRLPSPKRHQLLRPLRALLRPHSAPDQIAQRKRCQQRGDEILPADAAHAPYPMSVPIWKTANEASHAIAFIITSITAGQRHELVSRRTMASVDMHWQASA